MKNIFAYNSKLMLMLAALADVFFVNVCFIICCIPLVTIGAARTALHTVCTQWLKKENAGVREFLRAFKTNFAPATPVWLTMLGVGALLALDFFVLWNSELENKKTLLIIAAIPGCIYLFALSRIFEIIAWFNCKYGQYLRNSIIISIAHPVSTLLHVVLLALPFALFFLSPDIFVAAGLVWALAYFSIEGIFDAALSKKTYDRLVKGKEESMKVDSDKLQYALSEALKKIDFAIPQFTELFPSEASVNNVYKPLDNLKNGSWVTGFWSGILWHAYELTGSESYADVVSNHQVKTFTQRIEQKIETDTHDLGFLYTLSCVAAYKLTGDENAKRTALLAADELMKRYHPEAGFIQAWGSVDDPKSYRLIIDCLMNIPLLYWASQVTGDERYEQAAITHYRTTQSVILREDGSTYHTCFFDPVTHEKAKCVTHQGAFDDSVWARGQAWGIYGSMLTYAYEHEGSALEMFRKTVKCYMDMLPEDGVPYWDLCYTDGDNQPKDSSAAAIAVCGMIEGIKYLPDNDPLKSRIQECIYKTVNALIDGYLTNSVPEANGLLLHACYNVPGSKGVDEMNIWGDYFYMEALHRLLDPQWKMYW